MSRRTELRPLTDAEERCLIKLADRRDDSRAGKTELDRPMEEWKRNPARLDTTLYNLRDRGYCEVRRSWGNAEGRITDAGYELVRGMGD